MLSNISSRTLFPCVMSQWNKLDFKNCDSATLELIKKQILILLDLGIIIPSNYIHNPQEIKLHTLDRADLSHLKEHKFKYTFQDSIES